MVQTHHTGATLSCAKNSLGHFLFVDFLFYHITDIDEHCMTDSILYATIHIRTADQHVRLLHGVYVY